MSKLRECLLVWQSSKPEEGKKLGENWDIKEGEETFWNVLSFDGVLRETISGSSTVTSYPIDEGLLISDSVIKNNRQISLETVTSNLSYKVSVRRKDFDSSFTELLTSIGMAKEDHKKLAATEPVDKIKDWFGLYDGGAGEYPLAIKHGRAKYDNDKITLTTPWGAVATGNILATTLAAQVSSTKVDEVVELVDNLCASGVRVHVITMRGVRKDCAITSFSVSNNNTNAHSAPMIIELTQMTVIETKTNQTLLVSDTTQNQEGSDAAQAQVKVDKPTQTFSNPSPMSYFAGGFAFRGLPIVQNPVRLSDKPLKFGDKRYFDIPHQDIKISDRRDFYLSYKGVDYVFGKIVFNDALSNFTTSLSWNDGGVLRTIGEFPLTVGVNLVSQYGTNFESLVVVNLERAGQKIRNLREMKLLIIEDYDEYYL